MDHMNYKSLCGYCGNTEAKTSNQIYYPNPANFCTPQHIAPSCMTYDGYHMKETCNSGGDFAKCSLNGCSTCGGGCDGGCGQKDLDPILDPVFNMREVVKHSILLEDHLFHKKRRCVDCIRKHCMTIEAFLEEAETLDKDNKYKILINECLRDFKNIEKSIIACQNIQGNDKTCCSIAQNIRQMRKKLMEKTFNFIQ